jgi:hypothetical protein
MDNSEINTMIDLAEAILRNNGCRIQSFLSSGTTQYVVKRHQMSISPSFLRIRLLCDWVVAHEKELVIVEDC